MNDVNKDLLEALIHCSTDEGPEQEWLDRARSAIARAEAQESMNSSMREALRYIAWECPSYSDAVECAKAAIGDEGKIVPTAPGAKIMILTTYLAMSLHDIADALEEVDGRLEALESAEKAKKQREEWAVGAKVPG